MTGASSGGHIEPSSLILRIYSENQAAVFDMAIYLIASAAWSLALDKEFRSGRKSD